MFYRFNFDGENAVVDCENDNAIEYVAALATPTPLTTLPTPPCALDTVQAAWVALCVRADPDGDN